MKKILSCLALVSLCVLRAEAQETKPFAPDAPPRSHFVANGQTSDDSSITLNQSTMIANHPTRSDFYTTNESDLQDATSDIQLDAEFMRHSLRRLIAAHDAKLKLVKLDKANFDFDRADFLNRRADFRSDDDPIQSPTGNTATDEQSGGFRWKPAMQQSLIFLAVQHGYAMTQPKTRRALKGNFFRDYVDSVKSLHGWDDGGRFFTNYIAHPMQGAITGYIQIQNDPKGINQRFGRDRAYWMSRLRAMAWTAAWSTQFEIGPISQASLGNVGASGKQTWEDIVTTPTLGTVMLITEDALDRYLIRAIERRTDNRYVRIFSRMLFNPMRNFSNMLRFKKPWHRDAGHFRD